MQSLSRRFWGGKITAGIEGLVRGTGGDVIHTKQTAQEITEMVARIRSRYSLYYAFPGGPCQKQRTISVRLTPEIRRLHPNARVKARAGYNCSSVEN